MRSSPPNSFDEMQELADHGRQLPRLKKVFGNYIYEKSLVHFPSERGSGKTFFMLELCIAIANRFQSFCNEDLEMHGNTLYINCELNRDLMARRLSKLFENPPEPIKTRNYYKAKVFTTRRSFIDEKSELIKIISTLKPVLVVLDNWKTAFQDLDTNRVKETNKAMIELLNLKDYFGFAFVVVDHTKKGTKLELTDSDLQSGSGTKSDLVDSDFFLRKSCQDKSFRILKRIKSRLCEEDNKAKLVRLDPQTLWFFVEKEEVDEVDHINGSVTRDQEELVEIAQLMVQKGHSIREISRKLEIPRSTLWRRLQKQSEKNKETV